MEYSAEDKQKYWEKSKKILNSVYPPQHYEDYQDLVDLVRYHEHQYYILNDPMVSDVEFDQLMKRLQKAEEAHPQWRSPESPTQRVSSDLTETFATVRHYSPMLSLDNAHSADDLKEFDLRVKRTLNLPSDQSLEYCVEPKYDGGTVVLVYEDGRLVRAATRGNGEEGDEITANMKTLPHVPLKLAQNLPRIEVRGEALMSKQQFAKLNQHRTELGLPPFANPRNASTGGLRLKDPRETRQRGLDLFLFQLAYQADTDLATSYKTHAESLDFLDTLGFKTPTEERRVVSSISEVYQLCHEWEQNREQYPYEIDGLVIKVNDLQLQKLSGTTGHHPRWAIAYKFKAKQATSTLEKIEYQVGKIGSITPVAKITPVELAGVTVSSISLHNEDFIRDRDLRIGDKVLVERAGDVIPYIVKALESLRTGEEKPIEFPRTCPFGESVALTREGTEAAWRCKDCNCGKQVVQKIIFHVSKHAMDIDGLGSAQVERFYELGLLRDLADVYTLDYDHIATLEGFGAKSVENLKKSIQNAKNCSLTRLLTSLSIHHLGPKAASLIASQIETIFDLQDLNVDDLVAIKDIGPVVATNVIEYFRVDSNIKVLRRMAEAGVNVTQLDSDKPQVIASDAPLSGKTILFTGTLTQLTRGEAKTLAAEAGAKNISGISKNLDILVAGEKAGSKLSKANALGTVEIWTEEEFLQRVRK